MNLLLPHITCSDLMRICARSEVATGKQFPEGERERITNNYKHYEQKIKEIEKQKQAFIQQQSQSQVKTKPKKSYKKKSTILKAYIL